MDIVSANIGNALHSVAPDHVVAVAEDIYDKELGAYQSDINSNIESRVAIAEENFEEASDLCSEARTLNASAQSSTQAARQSATTASSKLTEIQEQIEEMQTLETTDPALVAKVALNKASIEQLTGETAEIRSVVSTPVKQSVQKASNAGMYIGTNGVVQSVQSTGWKIYQFHIDVDGIYTLKGTNNTGAAIGVCVTTTDVYALSVGNTLTPAKTVANGAEYEYLLSVKSGDNVLIPSTANNNFSLYYAELKQIEQHEGAMMRLRNKAAISWIDDDFSGTAVDAIKGIADYVGAKINFAIIPSSEYNFASIDKIRTYENEGHEMLVHPIHNKWYGDGYTGVAACEESLVRTIRAFREFLISSPNCIVYPGNSSSNADIVKMVKRHCDFGINCDLSYNNGYEKSPYNLSRIFISTMNATYTKSFWKNKIKEAVDKGAWAIIGTHSWAFTDTTTTDETTMSVPNLKEIIAYANNLCKIRLVSEVWRERRDLLNLNAD